MRLYADVRSLKTTQHCLFIQKFGNEHCSKTKQKIQILRKTTKICKNDDILKKKLSDEWMTTK